MTDEVAAPTPEEVEMMRDIWTRLVLLSAADRAEADRAMSSLVVSACFQEALRDMRTALRAKPTEIDLSYAVTSMERLVGRYAGSAPPE